VAKKKLRRSTLTCTSSSLNEIDRSFGTLLKQLPNKSEVEALLVEVNQAGMGRGLQFDLFKPGSGAGAGFLCRTADQCAPDGHLP
jgi:type IV pilus assembly protein PilO